MFKEKVLTEQEIAVEEMFAAKDNYELALQNFNNADMDFFEIANKELTIAQLQLEVAISKLQKLKDKGYQIPSLSPFENFDLI
jgi:hypothetical protein